MRTLNASKLTAKLLKEESVLVPYMCATSDKYDNAIGVKTVIVKRLAIGDYKVGYRLSCGKIAKIEYFSNLSDIKKQFATYAKLSENDL
jgi:hypothetical protein